MSGATPHLIRSALSTQEAQKSFGLPSVPTRKVSYSRELCRKPISERNATSDQKPTSALLLTSMLPVLPQVDGPRPPLASPPLLFKQVFGPKALAR